MKTPREKYQNDPLYKQMVDCLTAMIHNCQFTPSEMRESVILACIVYEEQQIRRIVFPQLPKPMVPKDVEEALKILNNFTTQEQKGE